ncbi:hypothetical protein FQB35_11525 [Crassaminicella thermophila]|uniref:Uncharacterized protein n=1 Tax=Crassaminicella thermophila TaxID=2599308 RepID=A0A5C0SHK5_CRATE|nr:hypothetical protein [Crassaminicella thermophila]QEK12904.1 hypothetical protein FQB35_11525 [Crassaminicella thermophila]
MHLIEIIMPIVALVIILPYLYPAILLPKIILHLASGEYTSNMKLLYKDFKKSILFLVLDGLLWYPIIFIGSMSTDAPSTGSFHISIVQFLMYIPATAIICVFITIITIIIESIKSRTKQN